MTTRNKKVDVIWIYNPLLDGDDIQTECFVHSELYDDHFCGLIWALSDTYIVLVLEPDSSAFEGLVPRLIEYRQLL